MGKKEYDKKYQKEVMKQFRLALHPVYDKDILNYIEERNGLEISKQKFVKDIIRKDIIKNSRCQPSIDDLLE